MKKTLINSVVEPLLLRVGSMIAGALVGVGLAAEHGPTVQTAVVAVGLLAIELVTRKVVRK